MLRKFFPRDKNYVLEEAQLSLEEPLLNYLVDFSKIEYLLRSNPLGIDDDTSRKVKGHLSSDLTQLHEFYVTLSGAQRRLVPLHIDPPILIVIECLRARSGVNSDSATAG